MPVRQRQERAGTAGVGELRQGALEGVMADAVARATGVRADEVRRAGMFRADLGEVARVARAEGAAGLSRFGIELFRPVQPMLAQTADDPAEALLFWRDFYFRNESWVRLLLWEGLELKKPRALAERQAFWDASVARRQRLAGPGGWSESLDARQLLLAEIGLLIAPLALPHITRLIFGHDAHETVFQTKHTAFLRRLAAALTSPAG